MKKTFEEESVKQIMHQLRPVRSYDKIKQVLVKLEGVGQTAAPVVGDKGCCIGILTKADIAHFQALLKRFEDRDPSVIDEMFETNEFGLRRSINLDFDQVKRHMTSPVVTIMENQTVREAGELLASYPDIHHLVVLDESSSPIGIIDAADLNKPTIPGPKMKSGAANTIAQEDTT